jgi:hypothetical protein
MKYFCEWDIMNIIIPKPIMVDATAEAAITAFVMNIIRSEPKNIVVAVTIETMLWLRD